MLDCPKQNYILHQYCYPFLNLKDLHYSSCIFIFHVELGNYPLYDISLFVFLFLCDVN